MVYHRYRSGLPYFREKTIAGLVHLVEVVGSRVADSQVNETSRFVDEVRELRSELVNAGFLYGHCLELLQLRKLSLIEPRILQMWSKALMTVLIVSH